MKTEEEIKATESGLVKALAALLSKYPRSEKKTPRKVLFENGLLCGKISALRWIIGAEWESFFKNGQL